MDNVLAHRHLLEQSGKQRFPFSAQSLLLGIGKAINLSVYVYLSLIKRQSVYMKLASFDHQHALFCLQYDLFFIKG